MTRHKDVPCRVCKGVLFRNNRSGVCARCEPGRRVRAYSCPRCKGPLAHDKRRTGLCDTCYRSTACTGCGRRIEPGRGGKCPACMAALEATSARKLANSRGTFRTLAELDALGERAARGLPLFGRREREPVTAQRSIVVKWRGVA